MAKYDKWSIYDEPNSINTKIRNFFLNGAWVTTLHNKSMDILNFDPISGNTIISDFKYNGSLNATYFPSLVIDSVSNHVVSAWFASQYGPMLAYAYASAHVTKSGTSDAWNISVEFAQSNDLFSADSFAFAATTVDYYPDAKILATVLGRNQGRNIAIILGASGSPLSSLPVKRILVLGGGGVLNSQESMFQEDTNTLRIGGTDRYQTLDLLNIYQYKIKDMITNDSLIDPSLFNSQNSYVSNSSSLNTQTIYDSLNNQNGSSMQSLQQATTYILSGSVGSQSAQSPSIIIAKREDTSTTDSNSERMNFYYVENKTVDGKKVPFGAWQFIGKNFHRELVPPTLADFVIVDDISGDAIYNNQNFYPSVKPDWKPRDSDATYSASLQGPITIDNYNPTTLTTEGVYYLTINASKTNQDGTTTQSHNVSFQIRDPYPPPKPVIYDKSDNYIYNATNKVFVIDRYPTCDIPDNVDVTVTLNGNNYALGSMVSDNGLYTITVTFTKRNNHMSSSATGVFEIDKTPPDPPIITIGSNSWQGKNFGEVGKYPNPVTPIVTVQSGCQLEAEYSYKEHLKYQWTTPNVDEMKINIFSTKGYYKIKARAYKPHNGLYSDYTIIVFQKKILYTWIITLNPSIPCYRTIASVDFIDDPTLKKMYKIDNGEWMWYRDPVKIYKNCIMQVKSLDGDDDYESNITSKFINIIDTTPPDKPIIEGVSENDVKNIVIPTVKNNN